MAAGGTREKEVVVLRARDLRGINADCGYEDHCWTAARRASADGHGTEGLVGTLATSSGGDPVSTVSAPPSVDASACDGIDDS